MENYLKSQVEINESSSLITVVNGTGLEMIRVSC